MGEWYEIAHSIFIGIFFSFLASKLISTVTSSPEENLRLVREDDPPAGTVNPGSKSFDPVNINVTEMPAENLSLVPEDDPPVGTINPDSKSVDLVDINEAEMPGAGKSMASDILSVDVDDDWEGVESTDLDATFSAAIAFVAAAAADRLSQKVSNEVQLQLYGLYKIATEGPCSVQQPSAIKISARAKWNAWQRLGVMSPEEAMQKYIMIVSELYPSWASGCTIKTDGEADEHSTSAKGMPGPVFNTSVNEEGSDGPVLNTSVNEEGSDNEISRGNENITLAYRSWPPQCCGAAQ
ncbi:acyl-CoA-binding domain-containing protein 1-like isoform X2 [Magnolia sinica]|uniref:acyl-CoA-binding domain-containing protein 1-like isoform X2 n=1 Tax=Magnolia sinica TaxID=86752 RepID=UPI0026599010|nr:acyl-CoA-binding domain-containing protein 1-like isoform X2 [Magnolia sinica]